MVRDIRRKRVFRHDPDMVFIKLYSILSKVSRLIKI